MTKKILLFIIFTASGLIFLSSPASAQVNIGIEILNDIEGGRGSYMNPYIINTNDIRWKVNVSGPDAQNTIYRTHLKMSGDKSCQTLLDCDGLSATQIGSREFQWVGLTGKYRIRARISGSSSYEEVLLHVRVPPVNDFTLPYSYPTSNRAPSPSVIILNTTGGSGSDGDPYILDNKIIKFRIDGISDPDGSEDIRKGIYNWAIYMTRERDCISGSGHHPIYSGGQAIANSLDTFLVWDDIDGEIFEWDTTERQSCDNNYTIAVNVIDQHGQATYSGREARFYVPDNVPKDSNYCDCNWYSDKSTPAPWRSQGCGTGGCASDQMYRTRSCIGSCSGKIEEVCVDVPQWACDTNGFGQGSCDGPTGPNPLTCSDQGGGTCASSTYCTDIIPSRDNPKCCLPENCQPKTADFNCNDYVDIYDFGILMSCWGYYNPSCASAARGSCTNYPDINEDDDVGSSEFAAIMSQWDGTIAN